MKQFFRYGVVLCLTASTASAQLRLPQPSPGATVTQTIGTTDITVKYSRPSVKGRPIFGQLVPYGKVWRTGANAATNLTTTTDLMVKGQRLPAGSYSVFTIPNQEEWTLIFNKNLTATAEEGAPNGYKKEEDALRVQLKPERISPPAESFEVSFSDLTDSTGRLNLAWADVKVSADLMVNVTANAQASIEKAVAEKPEDPGILQAAANWNLSKGRNLNQALAWIDKSIGLKEGFYNVWIKAQILSKMGKAAEALPLAQKALALGESSKDPIFGFFKDAIQKGVTDFQAAIPAVPQNQKGKKKKA
ncbi:DUF2911 domain-containing protein [Larkinella soli]|uniref:DUF2911 domain-containing protein n=1 Tax=Larkinella soli TaxID=1770527 RepID=UPI000FFB3E5F|nr:DUF2911 domain-containing protein [Larkinella soli]